MRKGRKERYITEQLGYSREKQLPLSFFFLIILLAIALEKERREATLTYTEFFTPLFAKFNQLPIKFQEFGSQH